MVTELRVLLSDAIALALTVADADAAWDTPWAHSLAGAELAAEEARRPEPETGSWPWLAAPMIARWALQVAAAEATGFSVILDPGTTSYAADVLCRGVLETSSLAWWLLDPEIGGQRRLARSLVYRLHSAARRRGPSRPLSSGRKMTRPTTVNLSPTFSRRSALSDGPAASRGRCCSARTAPAWNPG